MPQRRVKATTSPCVPSRVDLRSCAYPLPRYPLPFCNLLPSSHSSHLYSFISPPLILRASRPPRPLPSPLPPTPLPPRSFPLSAACSMEHSRPRLLNGNRPPKGDMSVSPPAVLEPSQSRDEAPPPLTLHASRPPTHTQSVRLWPRNTKGKVQSEREDRPRRRIGAHSIKPPKGEDGEEGGGRGKGGG